MNIHAPTENDAVVYAAHRRGFLYLLVPIGVQRTRNSRGQKGQRDKMTSLYARFRRAVDQDSPADFVAIDTTCTKNMPCYRAFPVTAGYDVDAVRELAHDWIERGPQKYDRDAEDRIIMHADAIFKEYAASLSVQHDSKIRTNVPTSLCS